jgi:SAM-dependent methyltransferase
VESTHGHHEHSAEAGHEHHDHHEAAHDHHDHHIEAEHEHHDHDEAERHRHQWSDEQYVASWLEQEKEREPQRRRQFVIIRALIPRTREQEFRYINLGAGPGNLDEVILDHFPGAQATLVDGSLAMMAAARQRLQRFEGRAEYVHANLSSPDWTGAVSGAFDLAVSTVAIHNLREPSRIRDLYAETFRLLAHGGMFLNLDYMRANRPSLAGMAEWAARDPEAGLNGSGGGGHNMPGTLIEQLGWLSEAGFTGVDVFWKDMNTALLCGIRDHLHLPESTEGHSHEGEHTHSH